MSTNPTPAAPENAVTNSAGGAAEELMPCPFCGGEAEIVKIGTARQSMIIACTNCGTRVESGDVRGLTQPKHYMWNTRHTRLPALVAAVDKALAAWDAVPLTKSVKIPPEFKLALSELRALQQEMK